MPHREFDDYIDAELRDTPVPKGLVKRLRGIASLSDEEIDFRLSEIRPPAEFFPRLKSAVDDIVMDETLSDIDLPPRVIPRARTIAHRRSKATAFGRLALAASLWICVTTGYIAAVAGVLSSFREKVREPLSVVVIDRGPLQIISPPEPAVTIVESNPAEAFAEFNEAEQDVAAPPVLAIVESFPPGVAGQLMAEMGRDWDPMENWLLRRWGVLGAPQSDYEELLTIRTVAEMKNQGVEIPLARGFDREFFLMRSARPPVSTALAPDLSTIAVPLSTASTRYDDAWRMVANGRSPQPDSIRVEDFLAAMDYRFAPARPGQLELRTAAGPAVFSPGRGGVLQLGVTAGDFPQRTLPKTHLTVGVDVSASMGADEQLFTVCQGLKRLVDHLGPDDRFSLIVFNEQAATIVAEASAGDRDKLYRELSRLSARGGTNLAKAWQYAVSTAAAAESDPDLARRLVIITDSRMAVRTDERHRLKALTSAAARSGLRVDVFDFSGPASADPLLEELVAIGQGETTRALSAAEIRWKLLEVLSGENSVVATDARMTLAFNPRAVAAYRLIGHDSMPYGGLLPATTDATFHVTEAATAMFEVWLHANDENVVATVDLQWTDPVTGDLRRAGPQRVSRLQFATSFAGSPIPLQAGLLAAETAQVLREDYDFSVEDGRSYGYRPKRRDLEHVLDAAAEVNPLLARRLQFQQFMEFVEQADRLMRNRRIERSNAGQRGIINGRWQESGG